jgi:hypothetical protein
MRHPDAIADLPRRERQLVGRPDLNGAPLVGLATVELPRDERMAMA